MTTEYHDAPTRARDYLALAAATPTGREALRKILGEDGAAKVIVAPRRGDDWSSIWTAGEVARKVCAKTMARGAQADIAQHDRASFSPRRG